MTNVNVPVVLILSGFLFIIGTIATKRPDIVARLQMQFTGYTEDDFPENSYVRESITLLRENPRKWSETDSRIVKSYRRWGYVAFIVGSGGLFIVLIHWLETLIH
jgi:hypothetical protein